MPDLLEGPSPLTVHFAVSLPHSLLATISLVCAASRFEGLGDWLGEVQTRLPVDLRDDLQLLVTFPGGYQRFTGKLAAWLPGVAQDLSFDELLVHLQALAGADYQQVALEALAAGTSPRAEPGDLRALLDQPAEWAALLAKLESEVAPDVVASLLRDGEGLKDRVLCALERFWHEVYAQEYRATQPLMERSVAYHRAGQLRPHFPDLFATVTGRLVPERLAKLLPSISHVTFIPSCYVGPYVAYTHHADHLVLYYNCRSSPAKGLATDRAVLYPPLKALADETRLQILDLVRGRELYAQQIVEQLDISQPAVSRHLNLMAAAGVLRTRREGNIKYYTIDEETLTRLVDALRAYL